MLQKLVRNSSISLPMSGLSQTFKKNDLPTFTSTKRETVKDLRLHIACQIRDVNTEDFFKYENQPWPPPLSQLCQLRGGQKADLALCLPSTSAEIATQPVADVVILDGNAVV